METIKWKLQVHVYATMIIINNKLIWTLTSRDETAIKTLYCATVNAKTIHGYVSFFSSPALESAETRTNQ
jgi:hypothetical protein